MQANCLVRIPAQIGSGLYIEGRIYFKLLNDKYNSLYN